MSKPILFRQRVRAAAALRRFAHNTKGVAAVEFALIVPIMAFLFIGAVEMSQAVTVNRRVTQVGSTAGDLVARFNGDIAQKDIENIMGTSGFLMEPYEVDANKILKVDISVVSSTSASATSTYLKWKCTYDTSVSKTTVSCTCPNLASSPSGTPFTIPTGLVTTSDQVVIADVSYGYQPKLFGTFMSSSYTGSKVTGNNGGRGTYTMTERVYLKPRSACPRVTPNSGPNSGSVCGC